MGRAPCCDKANVKKGPWSAEEDSKLKSYIEKNGTGGNWIALPQKVGLKRCGKSCRLRWLNYLRPDIKHGGFSEEEDNIICSLYISIGSRWSIIAAQLPGRTDNDIKNYWNTKLKKKLLGKQRKEERGNHRKQEMKKGREKISMVYENNNHQKPYWPNVPHSNQDHQFNDHDSIRKLLIKLGGRFSTDYQPINCENETTKFSMDVSPCQPSYQHCTNILPSSNNLVDTQYNIDGSAAMYMPALPGEGSFSADQFEEMVYYNNNNHPERLDRTEFLYDEMVNNKPGNINTNCGETFDWGEMNSLVYSSFDSNFDGLQQGHSENVLLRN